MEMIHISLEVARTLRDLLRETSDSRNLSPEERSALESLDSKLFYGAEHCSSWPR